MQPGFTGEVGGGFARGDALVDQGLHLRLLPNRDRAFVDLAVQWQTQTPEHQPGGFVVGIQGAVAEGHAGFFQPQRAGLNQFGQRHAANPALSLSRVRR